MKRLALLAALALVPPSVALAQERRDDDRYGDRDYDRQYEHERDRYVDPDGRTVVRDRDVYSYDDGYYDRDGRRYARDRWEREGRARWRPLAERYAATTERQFINLLGRGGRIDRLLVEGVRGAPVITRVAVELENRQMQTFDLNRRLPRGADAVLDLPGRQRIHRIIVYTDPRFRGAYSIYGT